VQSGAYRTILTHFSQRYPKIPKIEKSFLTTTCIAFDLMSINLKGMVYLLQVCDDITSQRQLFSLVTGTASFVLLLLCWLIQLCSCFAVDRFSKNLHALSQVG